MPPIAPANPLAIYAITKHGLAIAERIQRAFPAAHIYASPRVAPQASAPVLPLQLPMGPTLASTFKAYECHVHIISVGAVVRMISPLLEDKKHDPAVVCVDDAGTFVICVLSGHVGYGNHHTRQIAAAIHATPVITTASDVTGTLTVDILGRELGWSLDHPEQRVTEACAAVVNQAPVAFVQETGEPNFWPLDQPLPPGVRYFRDLKDVQPHAFTMLLVVSDRDLLRTQPEHAARAVIYRPKSLVLGLGCDSQTPAALLDRGISYHCEQAGLDRRCIRNLATIDLKQHEPGILALCERYGWHLETYPAHVLDAVTGIETPSSVVQRHVGTRTVAEAACLKSAGSARLLLPKQRYRESEHGRSMTMALARIPFLARSTN